MARRQAVESLSDVVATGSRRDALEALRALLAARIETAERDSDVALLTKQLREVIAEIESLPDGRAVSILDDLADRRTERGSRRSASARSKRSGAV